ncbi:telomere length regulation protein TEL2 homolog isoform X1 [Erpetoichthys calabaricus]|uniref:telomere length regulation protein TEL2 homolog isoform X1 n=1 Tax=Erpetoichthys calabaricus TaxID=27687 RepID=UPI002234A779|nr:telomere length regulation protein TEL2 homolog isoform X1 [Erpetoichthys calabaricus]
MDSVRLVVRQCINTLSSSKDSEQAVQALQTVKKYLDKESNELPPSDKDIFAKFHYTRLLQALIRSLHADWVQTLTPRQHRELWDGLFLSGPPDQAFLVMLDSVTSISPSTSLDRLLDVLDSFMQSGRIGDLLWSACQRSTPTSSLQMQDTLLSRLVALPDLLANHLQHHTRPNFYPQRYYPLLARELFAALEKTCEALRGQTDCSVSFLAQLLGKVCTQGHSEEIFRVLAPSLLTSTQSDFVWQRVCWRLMESVPDRWMEAVISGLVLAVDEPTALSRLMGNVILKNKKAQFVLTHKLLLLQYKHQTPVLRSLLGYLAQDSLRRPFLIQAMKDLCSTWSSSSVVRHTPFEQQLYISKALLISLGSLTEAELKELRHELLQCMLAGVQCHLDSNLVQVRRLGMVVAECLSSKLDPQGTQLKFEYEKDADSEELVSLLRPSSASAPPPPSSSEAAGAIEGEPRMADSQPVASQSSDSDLDSDDDLVPFDMSKDEELVTSPAPRYLRDCVEALTSSEDPKRVEAALHAVEGLVRKHPMTTREVSVELMKVLLHLEDQFNSDGFSFWRQRGMVALTVVDAIPVTAYVTAEFYALNYSLRQRLDMLEVLALSAQELSEPTAASDKRPTESAVTESKMTGGPQDGPQHWKWIVEQRIANKTKRFSKGADRTNRAAAAAPNRFAPLAGYFFFPLLRNYDRPQVTFDLLGSDHLVLGRLVHTLGILMYLAVHAPVAAQMGRALLDFIWTVRHHADAVVRQGVHFAACAVLLSVPTDCLLSELGEELLEARAWLKGAAEVDPDATCRSLALQALVLLEQRLTKGLQPPEPPAQAL